MFGANSSVGVIWDSSLQRSLLIWMAPPLFVLAIYIGGYCLLEDPTFSGLVAEKISSNSYQGRSWTHVFPRDILILLQELPALA